MKAIFSFIFVLALVAGLVFVVSSNLGSPSETPVLGTKEEGEKEDLKEHELMLTIDDQTYKVSWLKVNSEDTALFPNFEKKETAKNLYEKNSCEVLINGGFYTSNENVNSPIGLFISENEVLSEYKENSLFNGILSINTFGTPRITEDIPSDSLVNAVQTGPILQENNYEHELSLKRDKEARRMAAAITGENELIFLSVHGVESSFFGPKLVDMPKIISLFEEKADLNIADAINLDGGAASAFYSNGVNISEASPIGSFWCMK